MLINMVLPGAVSLARLPAEYQETEWIQSSGTQYIDSLYKPTSENLRIVCEFEYTADHSQSSLFGSEADSTYSLVPWGSNPEFYVGSGKQLAPLTTALNTRYVLEAHANNGTLTVTLNGVTKTASYTGSLLKTVNIGIFCNLIKGVASQLCSMKLVLFQIYDADNLVRDFVPCYRKADTKPGLYELVYSAFYTNAGSGEFSKGEDVGGVVTPPVIGDSSFTYSGNFTDNRVDGVGTVRLNTSGTLTVYKSITVTATIVGAGGGGVNITGGSGEASASGGGGGIQTVEVTLEPGTYDIIIGTGGFGIAQTAVTSNAAGTGGNTTAFGKTSTGGGGAKGNGLSYGTPGTGGTPNGSNGSQGRSAGGSPNGGASTGTTAAANSGGNGYVDLTFS